MITGISGVASALADAAARGTGGSPLPPLWARRKTAMITAISAKLGPARVFRLIEALLAGLSTLHRAKLTDRLLDSLPAPRRARAMERMLARPEEVQTPHGPVRFLNHGRKSRKRGATIMTKEPDSMKWIDSMEPGSLFWDIGANVGALTLYAAARGDLRVWAFEPSAVNSYILAANCELNGATDRVTCLQLGFGDRDAILELPSSQLLPAHSFSFAGRKSLLFSARQAVQVWSIDSFMAHYRAEIPNYIKIDVPGMTVPIIEGAAALLARPELKQLQIEAGESSAGGKRVVDILKGYGFAIARQQRRQDGRLANDLVFSRDCLPTRMLAPLPARLPAQIQ